MYIYIYTYIYIYIYTRGFWGVFQRWAKKDASILKAETTKIQAGSVPDSLADMQSMITQTSYIISYTIYCLSTGCLVSQFALYMYLKA